MRKSERHQSPISQTSPSEEHKRFVFLGGNLALDLVNTEILVRGKKVDLLVTSQDATLWWEMARQTYPQTIQGQGRRECNEQQVSALRTLRKALRHLFEALVAQHQVNENQVKELNTILREGYYSLEVSPQGKVSAVYRTRDNQGSEALLSIARAAMDLVTMQDLSRLHACRNKGCMLLFYDTTKSATRHWCSVACTNRARSLQNYRQAKETSLS
jgi:predicted RNA-binding Zn ribbon-like protein